MVGPPPLTAPETCCSLPSVLTAGHEAGAVIWPPAVEIASSWKPPRGAVSSIDSLPSL